MNKFPLKISTPEGVKFDGGAVSLLVKCTEGDVEILAGHTDFVGTLATGRARVRSEDGNERYASISGGFIVVKDGEVMLATDAFEYADEIDIERARAAKENAERKIRNAANDVDLGRAEMKLKRALNRIKVYELK